MCEQQGGGGQGHAYNASLQQQLRQQQPAFFLQPLSVSVTADPGRGVHVHVHVHLRLGASRVRVSAEQ